MLFRSRYGLTGRCVVLLSAGIASAQEPKQEHCLTAVVSITEKSGQFGIPFLDKVSSGGVFQFRFHTRITRLRDYSGPAAASEAQKVIMREFEISNVTAEKGSDLAISLGAGRLAGFLWDYASEDPSRPESDRFHISGAITGESSSLAVEMNLAGSHRLFQTANPLLSSVAIPEAKLNDFTLSGRSSNQVDAVSGGHITGRMTSLQGRAGGCEAAAGEASKSTRAPLP